MDGVTYSSDRNIASVLIVPHAVFSIIATVLVGLRTYTARTVAKTPPTFDEHVAVVALCILAIEIAYGIACPLSKLAVLTMFYRIFSASNILRLCVFAIAFGLVGWGIAVVGVSIFTCTPVARFWDQTIPGTCIDSSKFYIGITVPNIVFDLLTVALPIHEVWRLQMGRDKKLAITGVFLLGGSVVLASVARLVLFIIYRPGEGASGNNLSQTVIIPHAASAVETCLAIVGACLPPCAPLFRRLLSGVFGSSVGSGGYIRSSGAPRSGGSKNFDTLVTIGKISNRGRVKDDIDDIDGSSGQLGEGSLRGGSTEQLYVKDKNPAAGGVHHAEDGIRVKREVCVKTVQATAQDAGVTGDIPLERMADCGRAR
ncbi:integral membrane protein [Colletotrichum plurivorum]|uniref:Integral membrane protein n=1 Tax=Colletotrichum plurivorum TaxID=2175906 RepID=A0A8H6MWK2_9PEZI|nr:integral membrane protein [Colletotrichum plurivorum]